ncbi:hypothetical protein A1O3_02746 [Capronia epimyces CBS 606.96]|uniref:Xylanolytic transcriptional activator regulatory domain-containing protein n=1 Tax=Capronia epimyces CBS 606.96 TaxID=1182542 RepID=W9Z5A4_9EURO|nr:uncharacterized protein A1O3_02746 [Capronia epimyces CBS 606.96]EXJ89679.1 hypothetical protein A1O3_02746 [Capronia epimyces CBS 606.96]
MDGTPHVNEETEEANSSAPAITANTIQRGAQTLPSPASVIRLLDAFFVHFHPFCPILEEAQVRSSLHDGSLSVVLLRCILFVASIHCEMKLLQALGYSSRIEAEDSLFRKAKTSFDSDEERDNLTLLFCSYLLHYWSGRPASFKDSMWWLAGAIRCAQALGMHRSMERSKAPDDLRRSWRRIWWLLYIRDRQISISLGKPTLINDRDCDVESLEEDDFPDVHQEIKAYVIEQARLSVAASRIFALFSPGPGSRPTEAVDAKHILATIEDHFNEWYAHLEPSFVMESSKRCRLGLILHMTVK